MTTRFVGKLVALFLFVRFGISGAELRQPDLSANPSRSPRGAAVGSGPPAGRAGVGFEPSEGLTGDRRAGPGPWNNDVLVYRVGGDGSSEKLYTFSRAGVPTLTRLKDGRLLAAFQSFPQDDDRAFDRVAVCFSRDEGRTWSQARPIEMDGLEAGLARPFDPTLVSLPDGPIRLYFTSNRSPDFQRSTPAIYSAISTDGIHYEFEPGVRFGIEGRIVIDCAAALFNGVFHLVVPDNGTAQEFRDRPRAGPPPRGGTGYHAVSEDGLKFERLADVMVPAGHRWLGNLQADDGVLTFFGTGDRGAWIATSRDGAAWEIGSERLGVVGADPGAVKLRDGGWLVAMTGPPRAGTAGPWNPEPFAAPGQLADSERLEPAPGAPAMSNPDLETQPGVARPRPLAAGRPQGPMGPLPGRRVFTRVPSSAGGEEGIAVGLLFPSRPRFTNGAPIALNVTGGVQAGSAFGRPEYAGFGFVEIHFAFPGGGQGEERSGGSYDFRGPTCIRALADVIQFATGRLADRTGRRIGDLARDLTVLTNNCGIIGSSHGGNACGLAMALHGRDFPDLAWYASMESPYGEGAANVELGGRESGVNPAYNPKTGVLDLQKLAWSDNLAPGLLHQQMPVPSRNLRGAFYFDLDVDGKFSEKTDFPVNCFVGDDGHGTKAWYSPRVLREAEGRRLIAGRVPAHIPSLKQSVEFWHYRDAAPSIPAAARNCTNLAVIVYANEQDHVQAAPDHGHILVQVEGFRQAGCRFVRLNPDRAYVERVVTSRPGLGARIGFGPEASRPDRLEFPDNPAGKALDRGNIVAALEPARLPLGLYMQAAVCELADRSQAGQWSANLDRVIYPDAPWQPILLLPLGPRPKGGPVR